MHRLYVQTSGPCWGELQSNMLGKSHLWNFIKRTLPLLSHCESEELGISLHEPKETQASTWDKHRKRLPKYPTQTQFWYQIPYTLFSLIHSLHPFSQTLPQALFCGCFNWTSMVFERLQCWKGGGKRYEPPTVSPPVHWSCHYPDFSKWPPFVLLMRPP